ncbi:hypothetical protein [Pusillimonas noertemannii]|uniref:hypothetical protein n=1 Tax=Pusillimonas noertemannii TaxID=305977 RepID=UPI0002FB7D1A|nr:hypothetical protein [Pusillimonas noertemannii]NYT69595.1 hypothetical protein [Pusillimonas noertemannii]
MYLSRGDTIYVPSMFIERRGEELLELLQDAIREGLTGTHAVALDQEVLQLRESSR